MHFKKTNLHPKGKKANDCVVRAIAYATEKKWEQVYDDLYQIGKTLYDMPNSKKVYEKLLERYGWKKQPMPKIYSTDGWRRYTVRHLAGENKFGVIVVSVANHLTVLDGENLIDTWDCGYKSVGNYWIK